MNPSIPARAAVTYDRKAFFEHVRPLWGTLTQSQVDGCEAILDEGEDRGTASYDLAYMLATAFHETAQTMQPIAEYGKGRGRSYGVPDRVTGKAYYGRGLVQLTWKTNYEKASKACGVDLVHDPDAAMDENIAVKIMFDGMSQGWFTGKKLSDYLSVTKKDFVNARRIINGTDKAELISGYAWTFFAALTPTTATVVAEKPAPPPSGSVGTVIVPSVFSPPTPTPSGPSPAPVVQQATKGNGIMDILGSIASMFEGVVGKGKNVVAGAEMLGDGISKVAGSIPDIEAALAAVAELAADIRAGKWSETPDDISTLITKFKQLFVDFGLSHDGLNEAAVKVGKAKAA